MSNVKKTKRIIELDLLRAFAIFGVIINHTVAEYRHISNDVFLLYINIFTSIYTYFSIPLFVFLSGLILAMRYDKFSISSFYKRRAVSILPPYLIFSFLYLIFLSFYGQHFTIKNIVFRLLTASSYVHLWFFALIIQLYLLYPFLVKLYNSFVARGKLRNLLISCFIVQVLWVIFVLFLRDMTANYIIQTISSRIFIAQICYFMLGIHVGKNFEYFKQKAAVLKAAPFVVFSLVITAILSFYLAAGIAQYGNLKNIPYQYFILIKMLYPLFCGAVCIVFVKASLVIGSHSTISILDENAVSPLRSRSRLNRNCEMTSRPGIITKFMKSVGVYSFGIYLVHMFYIEFARSFLRRVDITANNWIFYPVIFISCVVLSLISTYLLSHLPYSKFIVGAQNKLRMGVSDFLALGKSTKAVLPLRGKE